MTNGHPQSEKPCAAWSERIEAFVDGELTSAEELRGHLRHCPGCLAEVEALAELNQRLRGLGGERAPAGLWTRIERGLDARPLAAQPSRAGRPIVSSRRAITAGLVAGVAALAFGGAYALLPRGATVVTASVNDFITYRARGWTVDHAASDSRSLVEWAQARVTFAVPELKDRIGAFQAGGVRLCWLLNRRLLGVTYASGDDHAVVYVMEAQGLALPSADRWLADGRRASIHSVKGHGVAVWTERDLVFVLVAAEDDFRQILQLAGHRADAMRTAPELPDHDTS